MSKKKWQAIKADTSDFKGVVHDGKEFRFEKNDTFVVEDEGIAREMESMYGKKGSQKLAIVPYEDNETQEPGHKYTFGATRAYSKGWERIFGMQNVVLRIKREDTLSLLIKTISSRELYEIKNTNPNFIPYNFDGEVGCDGQYRYVLGEEIENS